jgi:ribonuclease PH
MIEHAVPEFLQDTGKGWVTAEYAMLPSSTTRRKQRERGGKVDGRGQEIQRLIGRSLRTVTDMELLGELTIWIDCDVLEADGGTRSASITGAYVALVDAIKDLECQGVRFPRSPIKEAIAAVSVGIVDGRLLLDLNYEEDSNAQVDMNIVMTETKRLVEVQGTAESIPFQRDELNRLLDLAQKGILELLDYQKRALSQQ